MFSFNWNMKNSDVMYRYIALTASANGVSLNATKIESMSPDSELKHSTCDSTDIKAFLHY